VKGTGRETLRLFVAAELPPETLREVEDWQGKVLAPHGELRLNRALHLTLAFLGDVEQGRVDEVVAALRTVPVKSCALSAGRALFLPQKGTKRVVALELVDAGKLARMQAEVSRALAATGLYAPPKRPWLPHVTVARFRHPGHPFSLQNVNIPEFCVVRVVLYSSLLERAGAVHTPLADFPAS
jgi:2'-5' RNA ligase